ncbi:9080_t:CDS:10 [Scutellospora calospora]|uniref:9080_t:CDS:1 n=1 Tax=Scutellospora calospora TaxID=85575 RepID=A0ACA9KEI6_9GLOM|nr:9080_t:CDS:10 [Scutellospora calospora]
MSLSLTHSGNNIENEKTSLINMVYNYDWSSTLLGPMDSWEPALKTATNLCLKSVFPIGLYIGPPDWIVLYNEAWIPIIKSKHPNALGKPLKEVLPEIYDILISQFEEIRKTRKGIFQKDGYFELNRDGYTEEAYLNYTFSPIYKSDGTVYAIFSPAEETTQRVLDTRRLKLLGKVGRQVSEIESLESACRIMTKALSSNTDIPYALIYFVNHKLNAGSGSESLIARLIATTFEDSSIPDYLPDAPKIIYLDNDVNNSCDSYIELKREAATYSFLKCNSWPIHLVMKEGNNIKVLLKDESQAVLVPTKISSSEGQVLSIILIYGINRLRTLDEPYMEFLQFSNIEADQLNPYYRETNIIELTLELASDFKNLAKTLGLNYDIEIPYPDEFNQEVNNKIYLDHDMYETIIYNLCSNALKHTWNGRITIRLNLEYRNDKKMVVLEVSDTGVGIPETALPNIFQRFYRVEFQGSRSHEGTGIGLALVKELIARHGGEITVTSKVNQGTTFKCWFPLGCEHLPKNQIYFNKLENPINRDQESYSNRQLYLEESSQWKKNNTSEVIDVTINQVLFDNNNIDDNKMLVDNCQIVNEKYQILLVDDSNDMRDYLSVLLTEFDLYRACDGQDALQILKKLKKLPDLILSGK